MNESEKLSSSDVRIVLFGSEGGFSRPVLEQLLTLGLNVTTVVITDTTDSSRNFPVAVKQAAIPGGLAEMAAKNKVDILWAQKLGDHKFINQLTEKRADIFLVACFSQKIPVSIWRKMKLPCWNLHPSLLPTYRGPSPLYWQIINDEPETGLTLHEVTDRIDAGNIIARKPLPLPANREKNSLDNWVAEFGVKLFHETLDRYLHGKLEPEPQDETIASYFPAPQTIEWANARHSYDSGL